MKLSDKRTFVLLLALGACSPLYVGSATDSSVAGGAGPGGASASSSGGRPAQAGAGSNVSKGGAGGVGSSTGNGASGASFAGATVQGNAAGQAGRAEGGAAGADAGSGGVAGAPEPTYKPTPASGAVLAWEPCAITTLISVPTKTYVGCLDGSMFASPTLRPPNWSRIDVWRDSTGEEHLPARAVTALLSTDGGNEGGLLAGFWQSERWEPALFSSSHDGAAGWVARTLGSLTGSVLGLSLALKPASTFEYHVVTTTDAFESPSDFVFEYVPPSTPVSTVASVTAGPLQGDWVGTTRGDIFRAPDGAIYHPESWIALTKEPLGAGVVSGILEDIAKPERIYVTISAPQASLYSSRDSGLSWQAITPPGFAGYAFAALSINPIHSDTLYLTIVSNGVQALRSDDGGETWGNNSWPSAAN